MSKKAKHKLPALKGYQTLARAQELVRALSGRGKVGCSPMLNGLPCNEWQAQSHTAEETLQTIRERFEQEPAKSIQCFENQTSPIDTPTSERTSKPTHPHPPPEVVESIFHEANHTFEKATNHFTLSLQSIDHSKQRTQKVLREVSE